MSKSSSPKKRRWYHNLLDAYRVTVAAEPWVAWAMLGAVLGSIGIGVALGFATGHPVYGGFLATGIGLTLALTVLTWRGRAVSYSQIENHPGAAMAVLNQIKRGWSIEQEPVSINPRTQDLVFRMVGRPGVVLISEGPPGRAARHLQDEERRVARVVPNVPVHLIQTGREPGQVPLVKLQSALGKLPKKLTPAEVTTVSNRLRSLATHKLPIPKGIDPMRARPNRKATRGH